MLNLKNSLIIVHLILIITACAPVSQTPTSLNEHYIKILRDSEINPVLTSTFVDFNELINSYPGTKYASYARLRLAELLHSKASLVINNSQDLDNAEIYYRSFLIINPGHELEPYVLNRITELNYIRSVEGFLTSGTNAKPYFDTIKIFNNMNLIYPNNYYYKSVKFYTDYSEDNLADYEKEVGDWYFNQKLYAAAINRYEYVFQNFPLYSNKQGLAKKLIAAYQANLQHEAAQKYSKIYIDIYGED